MKTFSVVEMGSKGTDVYILQALLRGAGFLNSKNKPIEIDGVAGEDTVYAINSFQTTMRAYGVECGTNGKNDGVCGATMWKVLTGVVNG